MRLFVNLKGLGHARINKITAKKTRRDVDGQNWRGMKWIAFG